MPDQSPTPEADADGLWATPAAVLARYGVQGDAHAPGPSIYEFRRPAIDWYGHALDNLAWSGSEAVLDAGCGRGAYLAHVARRLRPHGRLVGLDFSQAMLRPARERSPAAGLVAGDVQHLPFAGGRFDVVLCAHMLYHVPDIRAALGEFRRVLRPSGVLAIVIGSAGDKKELDELFLAAGGAFPLARYSDRFTADNAPAFLEGIFRQVERRVARPELVISNPEALATVFVSMRTQAEAALKPGVSWQAFLGEVRSIAANVVEHQGAFRVSEEIVMLLCR